MNCAIFGGNLTADPISKTVKVGGADRVVTNFTIAVRDGFSESAKTEFIRIATWGGLGESCAKYLVKGRRVEVRGPVHLDSYINKYNQPQTRMSVRAEQVEFVGANPNGAAAETEAEAAAEELPFEQDAE